MKKIKIYILIGEDSLKDDYYGISNFIRDLNDKYENRNIYFNLLSNKDKISNDDIKSSEIFLILFSKNIDKEDINRFNIAYNNFEKCKKPSIFTYLKKSNNEEDISKSVVKFIDKLDKELGHFYSIYDSIDTIKLNIILKLDFLGLTTNMDIKNSMLYLDDKEVLSLDNIPMVFNNKNLIKLKEELNKVEEEYFNSLEDNTKDITKLKEKRNTLKDNIYLIEKNILALEKSFISSDNLSKRQIMARKCLENGQLENAKKILDYQEIKNGAERELKLVNKKKENILIYVQELLQRIDLLKLDRENENRFKEIEKCFKEVIKIEEEGNLYQGSYLKYAKYLYERKNYEDAIKYIEKFLKYLEYKEIKNIEEEKNAYKLLYTCYAYLNNYAKSYENAFKCIDIIKDNYDEYTLADVYKDIIDEVFVKFDKYNEAMEYIDEVIKIYNKDNYNISLAYAKKALIYTNLNKYKEAIEYLNKAIDKIGGNLYTLYNYYFYKGIVYYAWDKYDKSIKCYKQAASILNELAKDNPRYYCDDYEEINDSIMQLGFSAVKHFWKLSSLKYFLLVGKKFIKTNKFEKKCVFFISSLKLDNLDELLENKEYDKLEEVLNKLYITIEKIEKIKNEDSKYYSSYIDNLAYVYDIAARLYKETKQNELAIKYYHKVIEVYKAVKVLNQDNRCNLACEFCDIGDFYNNIKDYDTSLKYYNESLKVEENINKSSAIEYKNIVYTYIGMGKVYYNLKDYNESLKYLNKGVDIVLNKDNDIETKYKLALYNLYENIIEDYNKLNDFNKVKEYYKKLFDFWHDVIDNGNNTARVNNELSENYNNYAICLESLNKYDEAIKYYKKSIKLKEDIAKDDKEKSKELGLNIVYANLAKAKEKVNEKI